MTKKKIEKQIFLENLPKCGNGHSRSINWKASIGYKIKGVYDNIEFEFEILDYIEDKKILVIKYNNKKIETSLNNIRRGNVGKILGIRTNEFRIEIGQVFKDDKRDITIIDREYRVDKKGRKYYKYHCNICGFECGGHYKNKEYREDLWTSEGHINDGNGCACCCKPSKITVEGINDIPTTAPWMIKYFQGGYDEAKLYTYSSNQTIVPICPECGRVKDKKMMIGTIYRTHSIGCKKCSDGISYPNRFGFELLEQLGVDFVSEYNPNWCKYLFKDKYRQGYYDFYFNLNNKKYILEMDGGLHANDNNRSGQTKEESKFIDDYKDKLANEHNIEVIRIDCDYGSDVLNRFTIITKKVLENEQLHKLFDLNEVDWGKVNEYSLINLVKVACEYKNNNPEMTTAEIEKIMGRYSNTTIRNWLKQGTEVGWCNYDAKEEIKKNNKNNGIRCKKIRSKPVEIFKDDTSLGIFESRNELEKYSEELFGVKLYYGGISSVCLGIRKQYKGYDFKYTNKL